MSELDNSLSRERVLKAEIKQLKRQLAEAMSGCCDCPMFKSAIKELQATKAEALRLKQMLKDDC